MSMVDHPLTMEITAGRSNHLVPCTQSVAAHNDHNEELSAQHKPDVPPPSLAKGQEKEHWKAPQYSQSSLPRPVLEWAAPWSLKDRRYTPTRHSRPKGTSTDFSNEGSIGCTSMGTSLLPESPYLQTWS